MPSSFSEDLDLFDRFATRVGGLVSRAPFFAAAVIIVVEWLLEGGVRMVAKGPHAFLDQSYQLQINTLTTVVTFLLVALLQNTQARDNEALQEKLNAIADRPAVPWTPCPRRARTKRCTTRRTSCAPRWAWRNSWAPRISPTTESPRFG